MEMDRESTIILVVFFFAGLAMGFFGSAIAYLSWPIAPFMGAIEIHVFYERIPRRISFSAWKTLIATATGILIGGLPIFIPVSIAINFDSKIIQCLTVFANSIFFLLGAGSYELYRRVRIKLKKDAEEVLDILKPF